jgi:hypothetical protein
MPMTHSHVRDRSKVRLTLSAILFVAAGVALAGQAQTAMPTDHQAEPTRIAAPAPAKAPCFGLEA